MSRRSSREAPTFKVGDAVRWVSQAGGHEREKLGTVVALIPAGHDAGEHVSREICQRVQAGTHLSAFGGGWSREHQSYLVEVHTGKTARARPRLYWPAASALRAERAARRKGRAA